MSQHIGIVACSAEGAALCYRTICTEGPSLLGGHAHPEVSMHSFSLADYVACLDRDDWAGVVELMLASADKLAAVGAVARGFRRLGLTGTRWLVDSEVYPEKLEAHALQYVRPAPAERDDVDR